MKLYSDKAKSERNDDILSRYGFAEDIAQNINQVYTNDYESLVIGISGSWGNGKSTLMNFIKDSIEQNNTKNDHRTIVFEFNPWLFSNQEHLLDHFFDELSEQFESKWGKIAKEIKKKTKTIINKTDGLDDAIGDYLKPIKTILSSITTDKNIEKKKKELSNILVKGKIRLFIFIDDLDRRTPLEITQIFQLIKLNADFSNTIFFIAYDKEVIAESLGNTYKIDGYSYLEKIIQVDYSLPEIQSEKLEEIFLINLDYLIKNLNIGFNTNELKHVWYKGLKYYIHNLRDIKRYINAIALRLPSIKDKIAIYDFLLLESIRVFDSQAYDFLYINYHTFWEITSKNQIIRNNPVDFFQKAFNEDNKITNYPTAEIISLLLSQRFSTKTSDIRRFNNLEYYEIYFTLLLPKKHISDEDLRLFLSEVNSESKIILMNKILEEGRIENFFDRLSNTSIKNDTTLSNPANIRSVLDFLDKNKELFFQYQPLAHLAINNLINVSEEGVEILFKEIIENNSRFCYSRFYYSSIIIEEERGFGLKNKEAYGIAKNKFGAEVYKKFKKDIKDYSSIISSTYTPPDYCYFFLSKYKKVMPEEFEKDIISRLEHESDCIWFANLFLFETPSLPTPLIHKDRLNDLISKNMVEPIKEKLNISLNKVSKDFKGKIGLVLEAMP